MNQLLVVIPKIHIELTGKQKHNVGAQITPAAFINISTGTKNKKTSVVALTAILLEVYP